MSDAAEIIRDMVFEHAWVSNTDRLASYGKCECGHKTAQDCDWYPYDMGNHARHVADTVLAVLSETHAVVERDRDDTHYGVAVNTSTHREVTSIGETREHCEERIERMRRTLPGSIALVSREVVYGPWTPVAAEASR